MTERVEATAEEHAEDHPPHLAHHFDHPLQQFEAGKLGMWIFIAQEVLFFGGLFLAYAYFRANHPDMFLYAHRFLDWRLGGLNTVILLGSSFTMAWGVRAAQLGKQRALVVLLVITLLLAVGFCGVKAVEYESKIEHGLLWGTKFAPDAHYLEKYGGHGKEQPGSLAGVPGNMLPEAGHQEPPDNLHIFFGIYYLMTGLHALHVLIGIAAIGWLLVRSLKGHFGPDYFIPVDLVGLYWHFVDLIWIFLFPLLYLIH